MNIVVDMYEGNPVCTPHVESLDRGFDVIDVFPSANGMEDSPMTPRALRPGDSPPLPLTPVRPNMCRYANVLRTTQATPTRREHLLNEDQLPIHTPSKKVEPTLASFLATPKPPKRLASQGVRLFKTASDDATALQKLLEPAARPPSGPVDFGFTVNSKTLHCIKLPCSPPASAYHEAYIELEHLGEGSFGTVYKAQRKSDGQLFAIKQVRTKQPMKSRLREVWAHQKCAGHANVMALHSHWIEGNTLFLQLELCEGGSLLQQHPVGSEHWTEERLTELLRQIAAALRVIHSNGLVHLDVKMENVYQRGEDGEGPTFVLGDLGLAVDIEAGQADDPAHYADYEGDSRYLCKHLLNSNQYLREADIFSLGASIYELARGRCLPSSGAEWHHLREQQLPGIAQFSDGFQRLLQDMMHPEPWRRPSAEAVIQRLAEAEGSQS